MNLQSRKASGQMNLHKLFCTICDDLDVAPFDAVCFVIGIGTLILAVALIA